MCFFCISEMTKFQMSGCPTGIATLEFSTTLPMESKVIATFDDGEETDVPRCAGMSRCNLPIRNFSKLKIGIRIEGNTWELATISSPQCELHSTTVLHCLVFPITTSTTSITCS